MNIGIGTFVIRHDPCRSRQVIVEANDDRVVMRELRGHTVSFDGSVRLFRACVEAGMFEIEPDCD